MAPGPLLWAPRLVPSSRLPSARSLRVPSPGFPHSLSQALPGRVSFSLLASDTGRGDKDGSRQRPRLAEARGVCRAQGGVGGGTGAGGRDGLSVFCPFPCWQNPPGSLEGAQQGWVEPFSEV